MHVIGTVKRVFVAAGCLLAAVGCSSPVHPAPAPLVVAHYFNWFETPEVSGTWKNWEWKGNGPHHDPSRILPGGRRDIASVYYPLIGPYDSSRPEVIEYHILSALAAGLDGFVVDWYGRDSSEDDRLMPLLDAAARRGFRIGLCFEDKAMFGYRYNVKTRGEAVGNAVSNLTYLLDRYASHPAYLRIDGLPVVVNFSWSEPSASAGPDAYGFSADEWRRILETVRQQHRFLFLHDFHGHIRESYEAVADNLYPWLDVNGGALDRFYAAERERRSTGAIGFVSGLVYPGFDNTGVWGWGEGPTVTPREGGDFYVRSWQRAISNDARLVQVATWNDFGEGATIEPAEDYGFKYVEMTAALVARWKGAGSGGSHPSALPLMVYRARVLESGLRARDATRAVRVRAATDRAVALYVRGEDRAAASILQDLLRP